MKKENVVLQYLPMKQMLIDPLTKPLSSNKIIKTVRGIGLLPIKEISYLKVETNFISVIPLDSGNQVMRV